jgi:prolyl-tRNA synthetase
MTADERPGAKFATADLIGVPWQILVGPEGVGRRQGRAEARADGSRSMLAPAEASAGSINLFKRSACARSPVA